MAKKRNKRTWWYPVFESEKHLVQYKLGNSELGQYPILFDSQEVAYGYAVGKRMDVKRDNDGQVITNEQGYAQLKEYGKIILIGIKGKHLDFKESQILEKPDNMKGEAVLFGQDIPINKQTLDRVYEESDKMYARYTNSPLAKAGGITSDTSIDAAEDLQPTT